MHKPLADVLRPQSIDCFVGQPQLVNNAVLKNALDGGFLPSMVLWGPPGCGKTTFAKLLIQNRKCQSFKISAIESGVAKLQKIFEEARLAQKMGQKTVVFIDEIHRFNKTQQDCLLPVIEDGTIVLIGATTENPSFSLNSALLSRLQVFTLTALDEQSLDVLAQRTCEAITLQISSHVQQMVVQLADGDGRYLINLLEVLSHNKCTLQTEVQEVEQLLNKRAPSYDAHAENHYNLISALHKSIRGSDPDAALYWLQRMLLAGEDPYYLLRRLVRCANEDIGMADPQAVAQALYAQQAFDLLGSPEGELAIAQCVVYLATAPKSNALYSGFKACAKHVQKTASSPPPMHILNASTALMKEQGYGAGYLYDHDTTYGFSGQNYFPDSLQRQQYYVPKQCGFEREIIKRLEFWQKLRQKL